MTDIATPPRESFKPSMLLYDARYRGITIQIFVLLCVLLGVGWLINNAAQNLAEIGKPIRFGFLDDSAGFPIKPALLEYENGQSSYARAAFLGLLNTLLVASLGCIAITILGTIGGVLRLSNNWLISRMVAVYVEVFRNIPVLLWIFVCMFTFTALAPTPKAFRGENAEASMVLWDSVAFTNRGIYMPEPLFSRPLGDIHLGIFYVSIELLVVLVLLAGGLFMVRKNNTRANATQVLTGERPTTIWQNIGLMVIPTMIFLILVGFHLGKPILTEKGIAKFNGGIEVNASLIGVWLGLTLYTTTYVIEAVRSGIQAVSKGQTEAASALGLRSSRTMSLVVLPQAMRIIIPQLISQYLNLTKNSTLAVAVGFMDFYYVMRTTSNQTGREMESILIVMAVYLAISITISVGMNWYNSRMKLVER